MSDKLLGDLRDYWDEMVQKNVDDCARVDASRRAQAMRFESFLEFHEVSGASILDVGCGVGDLFAHLKRKGLECRYHGVDVSPAMVERGRERFPDARFEVANLLEWDPGRTFDYVLAIAIHNIRFEGAEELLRATMRRQLELCTRAAHVSLLTDRYRGFDDHILAWRAEEVLGFALEITPYVVLRHDYLPNDFSVTLYREPLIETRPDLLPD